MKRNSECQRLKLHSIHKQQDLLITIHELFNVFTMNWDSVIFVEFKLLQASSSYCYSHFNQCYHFRLLFLFSIYHTMSLAQCFILLLWKKKWWKEKEQICFKRIVCLFSFFSFWKTTLNPIRFTVFIFSERICNVWWTMVISPWLTPWNM